MHDDLIHRLRAAGKKSFIYSSLLQEAADEIENLIATNKSSQGTIRKLTEALTEQGPKEGKKWT